jgi:hypothetical protein
MSEKLTAIVMVLGIGAAVFIAAPKGGISKTDSPVVSAAKERCEGFVRERLAADVAQANGTWRRSGKIVVDVAYRQNDDRPGFSLRLCVYDKDTGDVLLPSVFDAANWQPRRWWPW